MFTTEFRTGAALDLTRPPLSADSARWTHPVDYGACQSLADAAREGGINALKYASARLTDGVNLALLACGAFARPEPVERQTWHISLGANGARAMCAHPDAQLEFDRGAFKNDPRIAAMDWER